MTKTLFLICSSLLYSLIYSRDIWTVDQAQTWFNQFPYIQGSMYIVTDAGNQLEMFQNDSFNPTLIDKEFGVAESLGSNTLRIFLHDLAYEADRNGYMNRINTILGFADKHGIKPLLAIFDSCGGGDPHIGNQGQPDPGRMMSQWQQSPGPGVYNDPSNTHRLEAYVKDLVGTFANDSRILGWDVFNEPPCAGQPESEGLLTLLTNVFEWARSVNPIQPLTSPLYSYDVDAGDLSKYSKHSLIQLNNSDVISFHQYASESGFNGRLQAIKKVVGGRPIIATEYMARMDMESTFENNLPTGVANNIGMINWGFIQGRIQNNYPWESGSHPYKTFQPWLWFHDIFRNDYAPYLIEEVQTIKRFNKCPKGYQSTIGNVRNLTCYNAYSTKSSYSDAQAACKNTWSTLATIESTSQNSDLLTYLSSTFSTCDKFYIGLSKNKKGWNWPLESIVYGNTYKNWLSGYPTMTPNENCVVLNKDGTWTNQDCTIPQCYLCSY